MGVVTVLNSNMVPCTAVLIQHTWPCSLCLTMLLAPLPPQHLGLCLFHIIPFCPVMEFLRALFDVDTVAPLPPAGLWFAVCLFSQIIPVKVVSGLLVPSCVLLVSSQPQASFLMCSTCSG